MHCLNLKLTYACTNRCSFCFSSYLKDEAISEAGLLRAVEAGRRRGCDELVLSGGEPTLCPGLLVTLMETALRLGYQRFIIQTNGSGLAEETPLFRDLRRLASETHVTLSFSVHGHNADIHDTLCQTPGAFDKVMAAMRRIADHTACHIYTNTVLSRLSLPHLRDLAALLTRFRPEVIQFAMMHLEQPSPLATGLLESAEAIRQVADTLDTAILRTEGLPYCLLRGLETCVGESYWPNTLDIYNKDASYLGDFSQLADGMRRLFPQCARCVMRPICAGVWKEHAQAFQEAAIPPIC